MEHYGAQILLVPLQGAFAEWTAFMVHIMIAAVAITYG